MPPGRYTLDRLRDSISRDIDSAQYHGAVLIVARNGEILVDDAIGFASHLRRTELSRTSVFSLLSLSKAFTTALAFRFIERGYLSLTTCVADVLAEFSGHGRDHLTVAHLLTHTSAMPPLFSPEPDLPLDRLDEVIAAICARVRPVYPPGTRVCYSPMINYALLGAIIVRVDPARRAFRTIAAEDLFEPLGMNSTAFGVRPDLKSRHVVPAFPPSRFPRRHPGHSNLGPNGAFEEPDSEMPWVGAVSTASDVFVFAEMLRRRGTARGVRMLSPAMIDLATRDHTGPMENEIYSFLRRHNGWDTVRANLGLGFQLRGEHLGPTHFGLLASPRTFGHTGLGSTMFWVDPATETTFVCLTAGVLDESTNFLRFQRLSDIVHSSLL